MSAVDKSKAKTDSKSFEQELKSSSKQSIAEAAKSSSGEVDNWTGPYPRPCGSLGGACY